MEDTFIHDEVWPALTDSARALVRSQHGKLPSAPAPLTILPMSKATRLDPQLPPSPVQGEVCRETAARVCTNVRDLDLVAHNNLDGRRLEVIADGLTLWHGAQLAIDTKLVSPLRCDGSARTRAADHDGAVLVEALSAKTYPELSNEGGWWPVAKLLNSWLLRQTPKLSLAIHLAKQGESRLRSQVERSSRCPCVYYVLAGPMTRGRLEQGRSVSA